MKPTPYLLLLLIITTFTSCVTLSTEEHSVPDPFAALWNRDLSRFEYNLQTQRHAQTQDAWTQVGEALLHLANCTPIPPYFPREPSATSTPAPLAQFAHTLVRLEDLRRLRLLHAPRHESNPQWHRGTIHTSFTSKTFFQRNPATPDQDLIVWPDTRDTWLDEHPAPRQIPYLCSDLLDRTRPADAPLDEAPYLVAEWRLLEDILHLPLPSPMQVIARPFLRSLTLHRADLIIALSHFDEMHSHQDFLTAREDTINALSQILTNSAQDDSNPDLRDTIGPAAAALRLLHLADETDHPEDYLLALHHLRTFHVAPIAEAAEYLFVRTHWRAGNWPAAAASEILPHSSPYHSAHAYFSATAHRFNGDRAQFLGLARESLKNQPRPVHDPFLGALYREVLEELILFETDERTLELLEELGPRNQLHRRQVELSETAIDFRRPQVAIDLLEPLLAQTTDARKRPRLQAILALAAFQQNDLPTFERHITSLSTRHDGLSELIPSNRHGTFFTNQDRALAQVLRAMLPIMAEWGDGLQARDNRRLWLEKIVLHTQLFLRNAPDSMVSEPLTQLYELASQLLEDHPRGYAQRVGRNESEASPLILGTVSLPSFVSLDEAPTPQLRWPPIDSLLMIPYGIGADRSFYHDLLVDTGAPVGPAP